MIVSQLIHLSQSIIGEFDDRLWCILQIAVVFHGGTVNISSPGIECLHILKQGCCDRVFDIFIDGVLAQADFAPFKISGNLKLGFAMFSKMVLSSSELLSISLKGISSTLKDMKR